MQGYPISPPDPKFIAATSPPMHTIEELESPICSFDDEPPLCSPPEYDITPPEFSGAVVAEDQEQPLLVIHDNPLLMETCDGGTGSADDSIEEDELLNKK